MNDKQYLENITTLIEDTMVNKVNAYEKSGRNNDEFNDPYELKNPIIHRPFFIKTFEKINQQLKKR